MSSYQHLWPDLELGWKIVVGSIVGFLGAAMGSVGGIGGGAIFVPMLILIIGFDPKSSAAVSKYIIMGTAGATVYYNLRLRHPIHNNMPLIDYDLALLFQPMLMVGISIGVAFNVIFADWMITTLLIFIFLGNSVRSYIKGVEAWKKETMAKQETDAKLQEFRGHDEHSEEMSVQPFVKNKNLTGQVPQSSVEAEKETARLLENGHIVDSKTVLRNPEIWRNESLLLYNIKWKQLALLVFVWIAFFAVQIAKTHLVNCSFNYWMLNSVQVVVGSSVAIYEAVSLYRGTTAITMSGKDIPEWTISKLLVYFFSGILAGTVGGLLGIGGGTILTPLFLELGIPPQVASATSAFSMLFSSSMSVVEYYILKSVVFVFSSGNCSVHRTTRSTEDNRSNRKNIYHNICPGILHFC
ncbi:sulfite exporter TauE/SafE family protein 3-like isoform X2 [Silene latifolia]|uniref:sulfite exporter TauE/SafE family protein 3-like isoform X2 n=1 Tax=Silene latifolia TaxID=37657 RepID=UPI003D77975D